MRYIVCDSAGSAGAEAARRVADALRAGRNGGALGLATGSSPMPLYAALAEMVAEGALDVSRTRGFALDEYVGLSPSHPQSYHAVIARDVVRPLRMDPALVRVPEGTAADVDAAADAFDAAIRDAGGVDIQILGIGSNGHIGFNEPGSPPDARTRRVRLAAETREANARFFESVAEVPREAVTQGIATILEARSIVLVADGADKASAVKRAVEGPVTADCPASFLQLHPDVTLYVDAAAGSLLDAPILA